MSEREELLTKITFIVLGTISALILIIGLILIALGYNEAFYVDNPGVQAFFGLITQAGGSTIYILMVSISYFIYDKKFF